MNIKRVKQGAKITIFNGIYMMILGVLCIIFAKYNMKLNFNAISQLWGFFSKYNSSISELFIYFNMIIGILLISMGIFIIFLSKLIIKRKEKIVWVILFLGGIITWAGLLSISVILKNILQIALIFFGWFTFVIGMILPIRYYIAKGYREY